MKLRGSDSYAVAVQLAFATRCRRITARVPFPRPQKLQVRRLKIFRGEMFGRPFAISRRSVAFQAISPYIYIAARSAAREFFSGTFKPSNENKSEVRIIADLVRREREYIGKNHTLCPL